MPKELSELCVVLYGCATSTDLSNAEHYRLGQDSSTISTAETKEQQLGRIRKPLPSQPDKRDSPVSRTRIRMHTENRKLLLRGKRDWVSRAEKFANIKKTRRRQSLDTRRDSLDKKAKASENRQDVLKTEKRHASQKRQKRLHERTRVLSGEPGTTTLRKEPRTRPLEPLPKPPNIT
jgi:hypothetical protein